MTKNEQEIEPTQLVKITPYTDAQIAGKAVTINGRRFPPFQMHQAHMLAKGYAPQGIATGKGKVYVMWVYVGREEDEEEAEPTPTGVSNSKLPPLVQIGDRIHDPSATEEGQSEADTGTD